MKLIILLAACNGAAFIEDQIRSIQAQTIKDWSLLIRDDGSRDGTIEKMGMFAQTDPRITLIQDKRGNLGVIQNFAQLMQAALDRGAEYVAFSDQDDIWQPEKLQVLLDEMQKTEAGEGNNTPILVHCDLEVVDERMRTLHPSLMDYRKIAPRSTQLESLLCQNIVTGCACLVNRALIALALPVPEGAVMHDWWLALLALSCGKIGYAERTLVRYRQHGGNVMGVQSRMTRIIHSVMKPDKRRQRQLSDTIPQACRLLQRLQDMQLGSERLDCIKRYCGLLELSRLKRLRVLSTFTIVRRSRLSDVVFKLAIIRLPVSGARRQAGAAV